MREAWLREPFSDIELEPLLCFTLVAPKHVQDPAMRGYFAYLFQDARLALDSWAQALTTDSSSFELRLRRAHAFYWLQQYDSTIVELRAALLRVERPDSQLERRVLPTYLIHYRLAVAHEHAGQIDSAVAAYRNALGDNLGLYMARVRLSNLLLARGDTAQALEEISMAADIAPREPWLLTYHAYVLLQTHRAAEAAAQLRTAIALDSAYSTPYFLLGLAEEAQAQYAKAVGYFETYLNRATSSDPRREWTVQRVSVLRAAARPRD
jgi:tetratricopeptide (TPR) repeat protein